VTKRRSCLIDQRYQTHGSDGDEELTRVHPHSSEPGGEQREPRAVEKTEADESTEALLRETKSKSSPASLPDVYPRLQRMRRDPDTSG